MYRRVGFAACTASRTPASDLIRLSLNNCKNNGACWYQTSYRMLPTHRLPKHNHTDVKRGASTASEPAARTWEFLEICQHDLCRQDSHIFVAWQTNSFSTPRYREDLEKCACSRVFAIASPVRDEGGHLVVVGLQQPCFTCSCKIDNLGHRFRLAEHVISYECSGDNLLADIIVHQRNDC